MTGIFQRFKEMIDREHMFYKQPLATGAPYAAKLECCSFKQSSHSLFVKFAHTLLKLASRYDDIHDGVCNFYGA